MLVVAVWPNRDPFANSELLPEGPNLYGYVGNNPVNAVDVNGEFAFIVSGLLGGGSSLALQLFNHGGKWHCVDWADVGLSAATSAAGFGLFSNLGKLSKLGKAGRAIAKASKKQNLSNYWKNQVAEAEEARRAAAEAAAAAAAAQAAKALIDCPKDKPNDCNEE